MKDEGKGGDGIDREGKGGDGIDRERKGGNGIDREGRGGLEQRLSGGRVSPPCVNKLSAALPAHFRTLHYWEKRLSRDTNTHPPQPRSTTPPHGFTRGRGGRVGALRE